MLLSRKKIYSFCVLIIFYFLACYIMSLFLLQPKNCSIPYLHYFPEYTIDSVLIPTKDKHSISAWFIRRDSTKAVILAPGKGQNRLAMINKAKIYLQNNYSVLMPDLRATGNNKGEIISLGYYERYDIEGCYDFLKERKFQTIGAHGHSLGAAAIVYTTKEKYTFDFLVLESCYDNIQHAFENRIHKFYMPALLFKPICWFGENKLNVNLDELNPQELMGNIHTPVLFLYGDSEWQLPIEESEANYNTCASTRKMKHVFVGGTHEDFSIRYFNEYKEVLEDFIE